MVFDLDTMFKAMGMNLETVAADLQVPLDVLRGRADQDWRTKRILDHGFVHLLDSMPHWSFGRSETGLQPIDARVVQAARVSMAHLPNHVLHELGMERGDEERTALQDEKLIFYLMRNRHTSPFEKVRFEFVVKLPIFIARQWIRHRMGSFNEVSARYSVLPNEHYIPTLERICFQAESNKQASGKPMPRERAEEHQQRIKRHCEVGYSTYETMLADGMARELARMVLSLNIYTMWYWTVDLHNLLGFVGLRMHGHAQDEIQHYGEAILHMLERLAPLSVAAWKECRGR
jgi:thymidylate synthase (FAD)